ncbi:hypothetical protein bpr_II392 (plasmid) [Butyrivibrio proteoclasticus B316]|uniref:Uncharacterized protein n=1 Tax=Butyrivibrio proteoclasticus (strain ATCC 51982 / DSM 14932 / B316) TaxID=515622 RepID=E0S4J7_BUTPB|nr:hypothetical protein [Butyrivibrio proteoclasticus]ADL36329.1 hypothetical protein bpr_II392 [Butyrivibrio proteoclasticus B316]
MKQGRVGMNIKRCDYCGVYSMKPVSITFGSRAKRLTNAASGKNFGLSAHSPEKTACLCEDCYKKLGESMLQELDQEKEAV